MKAEIYLIFSRTERTFEVKIKNFQKFQKCSLLDLKNKLAKI